MTNRRPGHIEIEGGGARHAGLDGASGGAHRVGRRRGVGRRIAVLVGAGALPAVVERHVLTVHQKIDDGGFPSGRKGDVAAVTLG